MLLLGWRRLGQRVQRRFSVGLARLMQRILNVNDIVLATALVNGLPRRVQVVVARSVDLSSLLAEGVQLLDRVLQLKVRHVAVLLLLVHRFHEVRYFLLRNLQALLLGHRVMLWGVIFGLQMIVEVDSCLKNWLARVDKNSLLTFGD